MQLKNLGNSLNALKDLEGIIEKYSQIPKDFELGKSLNRELCDAASNYSTEVLKLAASQTTLTEKQATAIFMAKGLKGAELEAAVANATLSNSQTTAAATTSGLSSAFKGLWATLKANPVLLAVGAVTLGITAWSKYRQSVEETRQTAADSANTYKETTTSIEDYVSKYQNLRQALIAAKGDEEETYAVKQQLLELQTELNKTYGDEYGRLNLVTDAYKDHTKAIKAYNKETANSFLNDIGEKGIKDAKNQMLTEKRYNLSSVGISLYSDEGLAIQALAEKYGIHVNKDESSGTFNLILKADAATAESTINDFMSGVRDLRDNGNFESAYIFDEVLEFSGSELQKVQDIIEESGETLRQILIAEIVKDDDALSRKYNNAIQSVEAYNEAVLKSEDPYNDENVAKARQAIEDAQAAFSTEEIETYGYVVSKAFAEADTSIYDFNQALKNDDGLKTLASDLDGLSDLDLQSLDQNVGENASFDKLKESAEEYNVSTEDLIDALVRLDYVQGAISQQDAATISFDSESFLKSISAIQSGYEILLSAQQEYNENGAITVSTLKELMDNGLTQYLQYTSDGLSVNTAALEDNEKALKAAATAELYNAMCNDIHNLSLEDTGRLSSIAQTAIASLDSAANTAGKNASIAAMGWWEYGASIESIPGVSDLTDDSREKAEAIINQYRNIANSINSLSIGNTKSSKNSAASSASQTVGDTLEDIQSEWKDYLDKYLALYKSELDAGLTDLGTFLNKSRALLDEYYRDSRISPADYWSYVGDLYEKQLDTYDKALSAVTGRIDREIDGIRDIIDGLEEQNEALENQKDNYDGILSVVDSVYENEIDRIKAEQDAIQDSIDALRDENDERELALKLEQAEYDLYKAQTQRTGKVFNGTEFVYEADQSAIRDAQETLADLTLEQTVSGLEAEKDALDAVIEELEYYRSLWAEIPGTYEDEINKQLAAALWGEDYAQRILSNQISDIDSFKNDYTSVQETISANQEMIDSCNEKIEAWEALKEQWSSVTDAYEQAQEEQYAAMILGAEWESEVLSGRLDALNRFRDEYIAIQKSIADAAVEYANAAAAEASASSAPSDTGRIKVVPYASGTAHAKKGLSLVGEAGTEACIGRDGSVSLVTGPALIPMEGGETVINAARTKSMLDSGNLIPADTPAPGDTIELCVPNFGSVQFGMDEFRQRVQSVMPGYTDMLQLPVTPLPEYDFAAENRDNSISINMRDINLHEVQNVDSLAEAIIRDLPNKALQAMHRRY